MTPSEFMQNWMEEVWNNGNSRYIHDHMAEHSDIKGLEPSPDTPEKFEELQRSLLGGIRNLHIAPLHLMESEDRGIGLFNLTGIDNETGIQVDFNFAVSVTIENDKIIEATNVVDFLTFLIQTKDVDPGVMARKFAG